MVEKNDSDDQDFEFDIGTDGQTALRKHPFHPEVAAQTKKIYIREASELLNRRMGTLRKWEQLGLLPEDLIPHRGKRGWRYWTQEQFTQLEDWVNQRRPGAGLMNYNPTEHEVENAIKMMRKPYRGSRTKGARDPQKTRI